jgi:uncharacterized protein (TIGR02284 family)
MLLNDAQIALNDLNVNCQDAADHYEDAAGMVEHGAVASLFRELAGRRRDIASELDEHIRRLGGMPRSADGDRETIQRLLARLKANLSPDRHVALLTEREHVEEQLAAMADAAMRQDVPEDTKAYLNRLKNEFMDTQQRLMEAKRQIERGE